LKIPAPLAKNNTPNFDQAPLREGRSSRAESRRQEGTIKVGTMPQKIIDVKPDPHIALPFRQVIADALQVKPPENFANAKPRKKA
jgi:hypothetical protein